MKKWILSLSVATGVLVLSACSSGDSEVVVETGNGNITQEDFYQALKEQYGEQVLQELVYEKVLSENYEVSEDELNEQVDTMKEQLGSNFQLALAQYGMESEEDLKEMLRTGLMQEKAAIKDVEATEEEMKEYYENYKPEIQARHILVADKETAEEAKKKLDDGEDFSKVAEEYSTDTASAANGGDLGWFGAGQMVAEFEEAAYALKVDEISDPVESQHGFHIIQVTDKKEKESYEDMKEEIEYQVKVAKVDSTIIQDAMQRELENSGVEVKDSDFKELFKAPEAETDDSEAKDEK
ncbi:MULTISPECIES: peptidylprolyl isomerase [Cytobacillus]|uniref:Foldase protein PrsA n=1 Tax=Cytobacillus stercorigallinarum TaxID=2762240 RepID=A0ABR8QQZ6_9BACI|nr:peptidylprolyl isomerase [Cytobacillus stercorigallinarum]MBD7937969.1 peptidylprolyl isomerase [Cytobacillus stercorigallinarum]